MIRTANIHTYNAYIYEAIQINELCLKGYVHCTLCLNIVRTNAHGNLTIQLL